MNKICLITPPSPFLLDERGFLHIGILKVAAVLERENYSRDPVIQDLIAQMQEMQWFMSQLQENYRFNSLAENTEDETA